LVEHYVYLAENAGEDTADRFLARADGTFTTLSQGTGRSARCSRFEILGWFAEQLLTKSPRISAVSECPW
jgi:hypothetical protein